MNKKLSLNKEVIAQLNNDSMYQLQGGGTYTATCTCAGTECTTTNYCTGQYCPESIRNNCPGDAVIIKNTDICPMY